MIYNIYGSTLDSQVEYVGVKAFAPDDSSATRSRMILAPPTQSFGELLSPVPVDERYIKAKDPVLKDGLLVGFDFDVQVSGNVVLEVKWKILNCSYQNFKEKLAHRSGEQIVKHYVIVRKKNQTKCYVYVNG